MSSTKHLNVGDRFTVDQDDGTTKTFEVAEKGTTDDGIEFVRSVEVMS